MILNKRNTQTARWDHDNNKWSVGTREYQWYHETTKEESPWMNLDNALVWIKERDQKKIWNFEILRRGWKNKNPRKRV
jgi:hypothetical protein